MTAADGWKARALDDFRRWLEDAPEADEGNGDAADDPFSWDWHELVRDLAALRQEVKWQNREQSKATRELLHAKQFYESATETARLESMALADFERRISGASEDRCLQAFLDVRDALVRGREEAARLGKRRFVLQGTRRRFAAMVEGYGLALRRFDRVLARFDVAPVKAVGRTFDPRTMRATRTCARDDIADGEVVRETVEGFLRFDRVLRTAEVTVNRNARER